MTVTLGHLGSETLSIETEPRSEGSEGCLHNASTDGGRNGAMGG